MKRPGFAFMICLLAVLVGASVEPPRATSSLPGPKEKEIPVVRNSRKPVRVPGGPDRLLLVEELTLGRGADENARFSDLRTVQADSEGRIYALDGKECLIKVFDPEGRFVRTIGKKGQGPGEFSVPSRIILTSEDEVVALDAGNRRLSFFKKDGTLVKELSTAKWMFLRFRVSSRGDIYADQAAVSEQGDVVLQISKFSPDLSSSIVLATEPRERAPNRVNAFPPGFQHGVTRDGGLVWAVDSRYEITVVGPDGKPRLKILKDPEPNPIREEARKAIIEEDFKGLPAGITLDIPSHFPPIRTLVVADTDHIIVRTYVKHREGGHVHDVFDPEGRFVAQFSLGEEEFVMMARDAKLYTLVREDAEGIPLVKRYEVVWK
jgi:6-bladed beta-propeller